MNALDQVTEAIQIGDQVRVSRNHKQRYDNAVVLNIVKDNNLGCCILVAFDNHELNEWHPKSSLTKLVK
jgi:hypothetical protein